MRASVHSCTGCCRLPHRPDRRTAAAPGVGEARQAESGGAGGAGCCSNGSSIFCGANALWRETDEAAVLSLAGGAAAAVRVQCPQSGAGQEREPICRPAGRPPPLQLWCNGSKEWGRGSELRGKRRETEPRGVFRPAGRSMNEEHFPPFDGKCKVCLYNVASCLPARQRNGGTRRLMICFCLLPSFPCLLDAAAASLLLLSSRPIRVHRSFSPDSQSKLSGALAAWQTLVGKHFAFEREGENSDK